MNKCLGCGAVLQYTDSQQTGYSPKENVEFCQRCFRIRHYDDPMLNLDTNIDNIRILSEIQKLEALIVWVVDIFDFESNIVEGMNRYFKDKDILLVTTKRDLLPSTLSDSKIAKFILKRLKLYDIYVEGIVVTGQHGQDGKEAALEAINLYRHDRDVVIMGMANAGKSTLINALSAKEQLTISRYPGTTLDFSLNELESFNLIDTPGLNNPHSVLWHVSAKVLKDLIPFKPIKPVIFQLKEPQSFALGGLARIDIYANEGSSAVFYFSERLKVHRGKVSQADKLWENQYEKLLKPTLSLPFAKKGYQIKCYPNKFDVVIAGLGWITLSGEISKVVVYLNQEINCISREAMI